VRGVKSLNQSLAKQFAGNDVDFKWDKHDNNKVKEELSTRKRSTIKRLPPCLPIHLKRFDLDYTTFQTVKLNERFEFPLELNMFPYTLEGRKYYDARGGSPVFVVGSGGGNVAVSSTAEDKSKTGTAGIKNNDQEKTKSKTLLRQNSGEEIDLMFVPESAPHPKEYYQYDLCGITIHTGTADGGHYFSYIRERPEDSIIIQNEDEEDTTTDGSETKKSSSGPKWCEFNDHRVSKWNVDLLEEDCFGGEGIRHHRNMHTGQTSTSKFQKIQNAFMLFYERRKTTLTVTETNTTSGNSSKGEECEEAKVGERTTSMAFLSSTLPKVMKAASKMIELGDKNSKRNFNMPPELYKEIWGQNLVAWKKRNLMDPQYSEFSQHIIGLKTNSKESQMAQLKFGTKYMLATLVNLPSVDDGVLRDWKTTLEKGYRTNPDAAKWLLNLVLDDSVLYTTVMTCDNKKTADATRMLMKEAMSAIAPIERDSISNLNADDIMSIINESNDMDFLTTDNKNFTRSKTVESKDGSKKDESKNQSLKEMVSSCASLKLVVKMMRVIKFDPSKSWPFEILHQFVNQGTPETNFILTSGVLLHLCRHLPFVNEQFNLPSTTRNSPSSSNILSSNGIQLLTTLIVSCTATNDDGKNPSPHQREPQRLLPENVLNILMTEEFVSYIKYKLLIDNDMKHYFYVLLEHLCWNNENFLQITLQYIASCYERANYKSISRLYNLSRSLINISDLLQVKRTRSIVNILLGGITSLMKNYQKVTDLGMYEFFTLACENRHVMSLLRDKSNTPVLHSFLKWFKHERENCQELRDHRAEVDGSVHLPWDLTTILCIENIIENDEKKIPQMTGYNYRKDDPMSIVGRRVEVFWSGSKAAYKATITKYTTKDGNHMGEPPPPNLFPQHTYPILFLF
jgi:hypothetical protein